MTKVRIRKAISRTKWQLVTFLGPQGRESRGIVDMLAVRKDHFARPHGLRRGDLLEIVLIQIRGGSSAQANTASWDAVTSGGKKRRARKEPSEPKPKRTSALDAAAIVLKEAAVAMNCRAMIEAMATKGLWSSPAGKTPAATLYSAILREIGEKGAQARFKKTDRGQFAFNG